jgi:hypothetical protein
LRKPSTCVTVTLVGAVKSGHIEGVELLVNRGIFRSHFKRSSAVVKLLLLKIRNAKHARDSSI